MKWDTLDEESCSLSRTVAVVGDRWTLLILRECFLRVRRFEGFQSSLQITRHLLSERLKKLVRFGILRRKVFTIGDAMKNGEKLHSLPGQLLTHATVGILGYYHAALVLRTPS